ncbi:MAG TPA: DNA replication and repair protein RecF, partial [Bacteroidota bacterium]|nr:DNA replication and repair protein RecF [Bacteroidota bacterium]
MYLKTLHLGNFRNHADSTFEFAPGVNILLGDNGQGKTNIIEAIAYLCTTKSFFAHSDGEALNFGTPFFEIEGTFVPERGMESSPRVAYEAATEKKVYSINRAPAERFSSVIGKYPVVICAPEHAPITMGGPGERRTFVDFVLSQSAPAYLSTLMEYKRVVKHRNKVLAEARDAGRLNPEMIEPWNEQLINLGGQLMARRSRFVEEFQSYLHEAYDRLVDGEE